MATFCKGTLGWVACAANLTIDAYNLYVNDDVDENEIEVVELKPAIPNNLFDKPSSLAFFEE